jgi:hypothetical protein
MYIYTYIYIRIVLYYCISQTFGLFSLASILRISPSAEQHWILPRSASIEFMDNETTAWVVQQQPVGSHGQQKPNDRTINHQLGVFFVALRGFLETPGG